MSNQQQARPQPLCVLVTGKPGSGKSTLALELGRMEHLGLPVVSRDAIKSGLVETWAFAHPGADRTMIETDDRRATLVPQSFDLFYQTIASWLAAGSSLIAEYGFDRRTEPALISVIGAAKAVIVHCTAPDDVCQQRFLLREQRDGKIRPDRLAQIPAQIAQGTDPWARFAPLTLPLPMLEVATEDGYTPALAAISAFCHAVAAGAGTTSPR